MIKSKKIKRVIDRIDKAIMECELYCNENSKLCKEADEAVKSEYYRAIDYYSARSAGLKRAKELIESEYSN